MAQYKVLDCTLRDGAYLIDKYFGDSVIHGIIEGLMKARVECIEVGFLQDEGQGEGKTVYKNSKDASRFIPANKNGCEFAVLADYSRYSIKNLDDRLPEGIDIVRECFFKHERFLALDVCRKIKEKGYKVFIQPVDILGYSDKELIEFIEVVNDVEPNCFSIVDTFGSMFQEDLHRVFEMIDYNLISTSSIGFHSHNNMELSSALSQEFVRMALGKRNVVVDSTLSGMGRGAGNTPTELILQYLVAKQDANYDIDSILDLINVYVDNMRSRCSWGYNTDFFVAGAYGAHVNNIAYLTKKNSIKSKDIRFILNKIGKDARKRYDYNLLENTYMELMKSQLDDSKDRERIKGILQNRDVLVIAPGQSIQLFLDEIRAYIKKEKPIIITVNFIFDELDADYLFFSNTKRYEKWKNTHKFKESNKIITSNIIDAEQDESSVFIRFSDLIKCGWETMDNSTVMLLRLLSDSCVKNVAIAGFDGYQKNTTSSNFVSSDMELKSIIDNATKINQEIREMLIDFVKTRKRQDMNIEFITPSKFSDCFSG